MEQNTADGGKKKADELEERDGGFHERTFRGEGMGIVYVGEQNGMLEGRIDYQEFDEENFQYVISPYWEIVDGLPPSVFQCIPGIDMDLRLQHYYRVNVDSMAAISDTAVRFSDRIFAAMNGGIDNMDRSGRVLIEASGRHSLVLVVVAQHLIAYKERFRKCQEGIKRAKTEVDICVSSKVVEFDHFRSDYQEKKSVGWPK